jgi:defect-in-organelle-trafficking protein DotA
MRIFLYILLLSISTSAFAAAIFAPVSTDTSLFMLASILGPSVGSLVLDAGAPMQSILGQIIEQLNYIIVIIGMSIAGYVVAISIANTAQEGTIMGKKWSAVWIPMRSIAGLGMMVPSPGSGYSMIQTSVMWVVVNGIGAADSLWSIVLNGLTSGMSTVGGATLPASAQQTSQELAKSLLNANVCMQSLQKLAQLQQPADTNPAEVTLYAAIHGTNGQPSLSAQALLANANSLSMYATTPNIPTPGTSGYGGSVASDPAPSANQVVYQDQNNNIVAVSQPKAYNFGVQNSNDPNWASICGTIQTNAYIATADFSSGQIPPVYTHELAAVSGTTDSAVQILNSLMGTLAGVIVNNGVQPQSPILAASGNAPDPSNYTLLSSSVTDATLAPNGYFNIAYQDYAETIVSGGIIPLQDDNPESIINQTITLGQAQGWITASSFYMVLAQNSTKSQIYQALTQSSSGTPLINITAPECTDQESNVTLNTLGCQSNVYSNNANGGTPYQYEGTFGNSGTNLTNVFTSSTEHYEYILGFIAMYLAQANLYAATDGNFLENTPAASQTPSGLSQKILNTGLNSGGALSNANIIMNTANLMSSYSSDPILGHAQLGYNMMVGAETSFAAAFVILGAIAIQVGVFSSEVAGSSVKVLDVAWTTVIEPLTLAMTLPVLLITWTLGASLFMYVPLIPFMIFIVTALGWLISVIEAVIAAPILALALVTPSNDELGRLSHGIGLLANLFLKPSLMIIGFLFASRLYAGIISLVNWGMAENYSLLNQSTAYSWMSALGIYISFVLTLANKCFSLIHVLPDKVMRWIGVAPESTDVSEELGAAKRGQESANKAGEATASGAGQLAGKITARRAKQHDAHNQNQSGGQ